MHVCGKPTQWLVAQLFSPTARPEAVSNVLSNLPLCFDCSMQLVASVAMRQPTANNDNRVEEILNKVEEIAQRFTLPDEEALVLAALGEVWSGERDWDKAQSCYDKALKVCEENRLKSELTGPILINMANVQQDLGQLQNASQSLQRAINIYSAENNSRGLGEAYGNLANIYQDLRRLEPAKACREKSLAYYRALGDLDAQADGLTSLALIYMDMNDLKSAIETCREAVATLDRGGSRVQAARSLNNLGLMFKASGEIDGAHIAFSAAMKAAQRGGDAALYGAVVQNIAALNQ